MKKLIGILMMVVALCVMLVVPASAAKPIEVHGTLIPGPCESTEYHPIGGKGEDDHYCQVSLGGCERGLAGDVEGVMIQHYEVLKQGPCETGPATYPSTQRAWGTFDGAIWDGQEMRSGTCKATWHGGWYWAEDGTSLHYGGRLSLHACTGGLKDAHAQLDVEFIPGAGPRTTGCRQRAPAPSTTRHPATSRPVRSAPLARGADPAEALALSSPP
jgi:hypothetical protein